MQRAATAANLGRALPAAANSSDIVPKLVSRVLGLSANVAATVLGQYWKSQKYSPVKGMMTLCERQLVCVVVCVRVFHQCGCTGG